MLCFLLSELLSWVSLITYRAPPEELSKFSDGTVHGSDDMALRPRRRRSGRMCASGPLRKVGLVTFRQSSGAMPCIAAPVPIGFSIRVIARRLLLRDRQRLRRSVSSIHRAGRKVMTSKIFIIAAALFALSACIMRPYDEGHGHDSRGYDNHDNGDRDHRGDRDRHDN